MNYLRFLFLKGLLFAVPLVCFAYSTNDKLTIDGINYVVLDGQRYTLSATGTTKGGDIEIPGSVEVGKDLTFTVVQIGGSGNGWKDVTSVKLPDTILNLDIYAFTNSNIQKLELPKSLTSINKSAFLGTYFALKEITVDPDNKTYKAIDGILYTKDEQELIYVPLFKDKFKSADGTESRTFEIANKVKTIRANAIIGNPYVETIKVPASVSSISSETWAPMGHHCPNFTTFIVDSNNQYYSSLDGVLFSKDMSTLYIYPYGKRDATYTVPDGVKLITKHGILNPSYLKTLDLNEVETLNYNAILNCDQLTEVKIPNSLTVLEGGFMSCKSVTKYIVEDGNPNYSSDDGIVFNTDKTALMLFPAAKTVKDGYYEVPSGVNKIGQNAFSGCTTVTSLSIPQSVENIGMCAFRAMVNLKSITFEEDSKITKFDEGIFFGKNKLEKITLPTSLKTINKDAFYSCTVLKEVIVPDGSKLETINTGAFNLCDNLESVEFQGSCELETIAAGVFNNKTKLKEFVFPASVTTIGDGAFLGCTSLTTATFPEDAEITIIGEGAFAGCGLTSFTVPTNVSYIGREAFRDCTALTGVSLSAATQVIHPEAFKGCSNITEFVVDRANPYYSTVKGMLCDKEKTTLVLFPQGQATDNAATLLPPSLTAIGNYAFYECDKLKSVVIPQKVTRIGKRAFGLCTNLESIAFLCDEVIDPANINQDQNEMSFDDGTQTKVNMYDNISLYVRKNLEDEYKASAYYSKFKGIKTSFTKPRAIDGKQDEFMPLSDNTPDMMLLRTDAAVPTYVAPLNVVTPEDGKRRSVNIIGDYAFEGSNVEEVVLLGEIRQLGAMAFVTNVKREGKNIKPDGSNIKSIFFVGKTPASYLNASDFELSEDFNEFLSNQNIYVKKSVINKYQSNETWSKYAGQIKYLCP